ncbi:MAG: alkylation response protein [Chloroflexi bacterium]|nr:alkylation response protein [Chloroflexota bacterium]
MQNFTDEEVNLAEQPSHPIPDPAIPSNLYRADRSLQRLLRRYLRNKPLEWNWTEDFLAEWGGICARQVEPLVETADKNGPTLKQFNRRGERVDELVYHPAYHEIGKLVYGFGLAGMSNQPGFRGLDRPASQLVKFAAMYLFDQVEGSISCPVSMTDTLARVLNTYAAPQLIDMYLPRLTSQDYGQLYTGAMFMTEKTGGSDVGATTTVAVANEEWWELSGGKWFCSNVGADLILTLARPEGAVAGTRGLSLFLIPRILPDGEPNSYLINRLKDKLGTRAMASGEVTFQSTKAYLIEPLDRGFVMMMEMVNGTRLHSGVAGAAVLRRSVIEATLHGKERKAFGLPLAEQPLYADRLADMIVDSDAATALFLETAYRLDKSDQSQSADDRILSRLLISLLKRYATDHGVKAAQTALEMRGGNGYIEDWPNARLLRDAYVQIIWEGGINMVAFDVLRTLERDNAWHIYAAALQAELAGINSPGLNTPVNSLRTCLDLLGREVERLMVQPRSIQEIAAPQLAEAMAALYAAVLLIVQAHDSLITKDPAAKRDLEAARRYYTRFLQPILEALKRPANTGAVHELIEGAIMPEQTT